MRYKVTVEAEPENGGHRMRIQGLQHLLAESWEEYKGKDHDELLQQYHYDKSVPPFWSVGIAEVRCFTLPCAVWLAIYDLVQIHEEIKNGSRFDFDYEGETYTVVVDNAWPRCPDASMLEHQFRTMHQISKEYR